MNRGISSIILRTNVGKMFINPVRNDYVLKELSVDNVVSKNEPLLRSIPRNIKWDSFLRNYLRRA